MVCTFATEPFNTLRAPNPVREMVNTVPVNLSLRWQSWSNCLLERFDFLWVHNLTLPGLGRGLRVRVAHFFSRQYLQFAATAIALDP